MNFHTLCMTVWEKPRPWRACTYAQGATDLPGPWLLADVISTKTAHCTRVDPKGGVGGCVCVWGGGGAGFWTPPGKSQVVIGFLRNTGTDPPRERFTWPTVKRFLDPPMLHSYKLVEYLKDRCYIYMRVYG